MKKWMIWLMFVCAVIVPTPNDTFPKVVKRSFYCGKYVTNKYYGKAKNFIPIKFGPSFRPSLSVIPSASIPVILPRKEDIGISANVRLLRAIRFPSIIATQFTDTMDSMGGRLNPWNKPGIALPAMNLFGRKVLIHSPDTGITKELPVVDCGPWNKYDNYIDEKRRPSAESGKSQLRKYSGRETNRAGVDITPAGWKELGYKNLPGKTKVDIIVILNDVLPWAR